MTSENNLEDEYENINEEVEGASNIMKKYAIVYIFKIKCWQFHSKSKWSKGRNLRFCSCTCWNNWKFHKTSGTNEIDTEGEDLSENTSTDSENDVLDLGAELEKEETNNEHWKRGFRKWGRNGQW